MKRDDKVDVSDIVRQSFREAMKTHGLVREQEEVETPKEAFTEKFDVKKHLSYMQLLPKQFGRKGTYEAADLDAVMKTLVGNEKPGLQRFKNAISKLNIALGKVPSQFGITSGQETGDVSKVNQIFSALQLNHLLVSIINKQDSRVAGKMFEGLAARMLGGTTVTKEDVIEDMVVDGDQLISLKLIEPSVTDFKGSKFGLAEGIARNGSVTYLVCEKDKQNDPFSFKAYSFVINKQNYFNFISRTGSDKRPLTPEEIKKLIDEVSVLDRKEVKKESINHKKQSITEAKTDAQEIFNKVLMKYAVSELGADEENREDAIKKLREKLTNIISNSTESFAFRELKRNKLFYEQVLSKIEKIKESITTSIGANFLKRNNFEASFDAIKNLSTVIADERTLVTYFANNATDMEEYFAELFKSLRELLVFFEKIDNLYQQEEEDTKKAKIAAGKSYGELLKTSYAGMQDMINTFFDQIYSGNRKRNEKSEVNPQFSLKGPAIKNLAMSLGADYDDSYEQFIVSSKLLMVNSEKNRVALENWIAPIYEQFYALDINLKKFFIKDEPNGLKEASTATDKLKDEINKMPKTASGEFEQASKISGETPKQLQENNKKPLTKHWTEIMIEELMRQ